MTMSGPGNLERILVVEDSPVQAAQVCDVLDQQGYRISWSTTIAEARERARTSPPDLFLLDRGLPDGDGSMLCRELKADPSTREIPSILLTAQDRVGERVEGLLGVPTIIPPSRTTEMSYWRGFMAACGPACCSRRFGRKRRNSNR